MPDPIKPRNTVKIKKRKVLDAYFASMKTENVAGEETKEDYKVKSGDTLDKIAKKKGTTVAKIIELNDNITEANKDDITVGQKIKLSKKSTKKKVTFERLNSANLGDEVYVIVKTDNLQDMLVGINVIQGKAKGILEKDKAIWLQQDGNDVRFPKNRVGKFGSDDENIANKDDFKDLAVIKIKLGSKDSTEQKKYTDALETLTDKKTKLHLLIDAHSENDITVIYNGRNPDKDGEPDDRTTPNYWLDFDGKWFELKEGCGIKITPEILKEIFPNSKEKRRKEVSKAINKYKCEFEINNIDRMAHFLGQIGTETAELNKLEEDYRYSAKIIYKIFLRKVLVPHPTKSKKQTFRYHDLIEGYDADLSVCTSYGHNRDVTDPIEVTEVDGLASWTYTEFNKLYTIKSDYIKSTTLFDYVYGCRMGNGNKATKDGSDYFGVGFIHLTGKSKYKMLHDTWKKKYPDDKKDFMGDDISLLKTDVDVAMKASMIIWVDKTKKTNKNADVGNTNKAITKVTLDVNGGDNGLEMRKKYTKKAYKVLNKIKK